MLNLRRTVHRLLDLTVPRFGPWAQLALDDGDRLTLVSLREGEPVRTRELRGRAVTPQLRGALRDLRARSGRTLHTPDLPADLLEITGPNDGDVVLLPVALTTQAAVAAVLVVATPRRDPSELRDLARRGARALTVAQVYEERTALAGTLRAAVVPPPLPHAPGLDLGSTYRPAMETTQVGGDFFDVHPAGEGSWSITVGDVCGKGVEAAVLNGQVRQSLRTAALVTTDPAQTLRIVNDTMLAARTDNFVTMLHGRLTVVDGGVDVTVATGGHPPPLLLRLDGTVEPVEVRGSLVGMRPDATFGAATVRLCPGELLLAYTDGAAEARGDGDLLGEARLATELGDCAGLPAQTVAERMMQLVFEHLDGRAHDDVAFVVVGAQS